MAGLGNVEAATILLDYGASIDATAEFQVYTPLLLASRTGNAAMIALLLDRGAPLHSCSVSGSNYANEIVAFHPSSLPRQIVSKATDHLQPSLSEESPLSSIVENYRDAYTMYRQLN